MLKDTLLLLALAIVPGACAETLPERTASTTTGGIIPYFADGAGWTTSFTINCLSTTCPFNFAYIGTDGRQVALATRITAPGQNGETETTSTASSFNISIRLNESVLIETLGRGSQTVTGAVDLQSSSLLAGFATFRRHASDQPDYEATVLMEPRIFTGHFIVSFDNRDGFVTGVALTNLTNNARADVVVVGTDLSNRTLFTSLISLDPLNATTFSVPERFAATAGKLGRLEFTVQNAFIIGTGFRFNPTGPFTTLPVFQLR